MRLAFLALLSLALFSCSKDDESKPHFTAFFQSVIGKRIYFDSTVVVTNGVYRSDVYPKEFEISVVYNADNTCTWNGISGYDYYKFEAPAKIYYWNEGETLNNDTYETIISAEDKKIHMKYFVNVPGFVRTIDKYLHYD